MSDKIEVDFKELADQINAKIKVAAEAMREANDLAEAAGVRLNIDEYDDEARDKFDLLSEEDQEKHNEFRYKMVSITPLFDEIDEAGWRTSSIGC